MKSGALVFLAVFIALSASWAGFVLAPQIQLGRELQTPALGDAGLYPQARPGMAAQGAVVYRAEGCVNCHSQQVSQEGVRSQVILTEVSTNAAALLQVLRANGLPLANLETLTKLPIVVTNVPDASSGEPIAKSINATDSKAHVEVSAFGPDIGRHWGQRRSVAQDYLFDHPAQPGSRRMGPDLSNVGLARPDAKWHLLHLYAPASQVNGSTMPPYRFLFETRKIKGKPSADALKFPDGFGPDKDYEVVPTQRALELAAYLVSLKADAPLFEAPVTPPPALVTVVSTNAPVTQ
jgi:cbb3-type cytochrome oxidase cytochrome c subunit